MPLTIYKASAGSGKTFTLATRFIAYLLAEEGGTYKHLLAVTFTKKATAEMKERILQKLYDMGHATPQAAAADGFFRAVAQELPNIPPAILQQRARHALRAIIHDYDHFRVETIDSFFQSLLANLAHELGLPAGYKVDLNDTDVLGRAVDRLLANLDKNKEVLPWVLQYVRQRIADEQKWDVSQEVKRLAKELLSEAYMLYGDELRKLPLSSALLGKYRATLRHTAQTARQEVYQLALDLDNDLEKSGGYNELSNGRRCLGSFLKHLIAWESDPMLKGKTAPSLTVLSYRDDYENMVKGSGKARKVSEARAKAVHPRLCALLDTLQKAIRTVNSCELSAQWLNPLGLLDKIDRMVEDINNETNHFMLAKTPILFRRLVGSDDASFVFERAGTQFNHVMIDEFQDTSPLQWANMRNLLVENLSAGQSCLLVGDAKQGIYRFRGGDWNILQELTSTTSPTHATDVRTLHTNYRSGGVVVGFNNALFVQAAKEIDGISGGHVVQDIYADVAQECAKSPTGYVRVRIELPAEKDKKKKDKADTPAQPAPTPPADPYNTEAEVAEQMLRLHREGVPWQDMAILVKRNKEIDALLNLFADRHPEIPLVSDDSFLLAASPSVQVIISALRTLENPQDGISRAFVASYYRREVAQQPESTWPDISDHVADILPEEFNLLRNQTHHIPLFNLIERIVTIFKLDTAEGSAPYLFFFMDAVLAYLDDAPSDLTRFLCYWDESLCSRSIPSTAVDGVRILTIHKSKGLAFHTVFMPYTSWSLERDLNNFHQLDLLWCRPSERPYSDIPLLPITSRSIAEQSIYADNYIKEHRERRIESLNVLYVAFTRAKQNLLVWSKRTPDPAKPKVYPPPPSTVGDVLLKSLQAMTELKPTENVPEHHVLYEWGAPSTADITASSTPDSTESNLHQPPSNPLVFRPGTQQVGLHIYPMRAQFRQSSNARFFMSSAANDTLPDDMAATPSQAGVVLHDLMAHIRTADDVEPAVRAFMLRGMLPPTLTADDLCAFVRSRIAHRQVASWFDGSWQLFRESTILARGEGGEMQIHRPDRVMVRRDEAVVVDFKFGKPHDEYAPQVERYCQLLRRMGQKNVRGYLWYMFSNRVVEV